MGSPTLAFENLVGPIASRRLACTDRIRLAGIHLNRARSRIPSLRYIDAIPDDFHGDPKFLRRRFWKLAYAPTAQFIELIVRLAVALEYPLW